MIIKRTWERRKLGGLKIFRYDGWFLFGVLPIYIDRITVR